jgi:hypothetical protein
MANYSHKDVTLLVGAVLGAIEKLPKTSDERRITTPVPNSLSTNGKCSCQGLVVKIVVVDYP